MYYATAIAILAKLYELFFPSGYSTSLSMAT
jgi:hypothetical protein